MLAACELVVGDLALERLPALATDALVRGVESPTLGELAAQDRSDVRESRDLFLRVLEELGVELPDPDRARWILVLETAHAIVDGELTPGVGAGNIAYWRLDIRDEGDLRIFAGLASILEDHPEDIAELDEQIVAEAGELLRRSRPRTWIRLRAGDQNSGLTRSAGQSQVNVDPATLAVSIGLRRELAAWTAEHTRVMAGWPLMGGFVSMTDAERFVGAGRRVAVRLQSELGADFYVEYWPEPIRPPGVKLRTRGGTVTT